MAGWPEARKRESDLAPPRPQISIVRQPHSSGIVKSTPFFAGAPHFIGFRPAFTPETGRARCPLRAGSGGLRTGGLRTARSTLNAKAHPRMGPGMSGMGDHMGADAPHLPVAPVIPPADPCRGLRPAQKRRFHVGVVYFCAASSRARTINAGRSVLSAGPRRAGCPARSGSAGTAGLGPVPAVEASGPGPLGGSRPHAWRMAACTVAGSATRFIRNSAWPRSRR